MFSIYGLLHVSDKARDGANTKTRSSASRIDQYLHMALRLAAGVRSAFGVPLTLATNRSQFITDRLSNLAMGPRSDAIQIIQPPLESPIPEDADFYSASHKVVLFDYFAGRGEYSLLLDLDVLCLPNASASMIDLMSSGIPLCYDISDQVFPAYGNQRIYDDMCKFGPTARSFRWYGGELIGGPPSFFAALHKEALGALDAYAYVYKSLHHQGDEMITTYCLNALRARADLPELYDAGSSDFIRRYWGKPTLHDERRLTRLDALQFLHLPAMKEFLSSGMSDRMILRVLRLLDPLPRWLSRPIYRVGETGVRWHRPF